MKLMLTVGRKKSQLSGTKQDWLTPKNIAYDKDSNGHFFMAGLIPNDLNLTGHI